MGLLKLNDCLDSASRADLSDVIEVANVEAAVWAGRESNGGQEALVRGQAVACVSAVDGALPSRAHRCQNHPRLLLEEHVRSVPLQQDPCCMKPNLSSLRFDMATR
jgi:hypothetical protein